MTNDQVFVIVGASLAGAKAAETLRSEGFEGRIVLVGEEPVRPYERPPLSKGYLRGEVNFDAAAVHPEGFYEEPKRTASIKHPLWTQTADELLGGFSEEGEPIGAPLVRERSAV